MNYSKSLTKLTVKLIFIIILFAEFSYSQIIENNYSTTESSSDTTFQMTKSPWGAVARSAIIPGWGQFYNESYWKIPVIWGTAAWFVYNWIDNDRLYNDYKSLYQTTENEYYRIL
ncbi:MAG: DUF5683 domain-containing protein, partial [Ignavibacterium sp.]